MPDFIISWVICFVIWDEKRTIRFSYTLRHARLIWNGILNGQMVSYSKWTLYTMLLTFLRLLAVALGTWRCYMRLSFLRCSRNWRGLGRWWEWMKVVRNSRWFLLFLGSVDGLCVSMHPKKRPINNLKQDHTLDFCFLYVRVRTALGLGGVAALLHEVPGATCIQTNHMVRSNSICSIGSALTCII